MTIKISKEQEIIQEGIEVLFKHLGPAKATRFLSALHAGEGNYLDFGKQLFSEETVGTLFKKVEAYQKEKGRKSDKACHQ